MIEIILAVTTPQSVVSQPRCDANQITIIPPSYLAVTNTYTDTDTASLRIIISIYSEINTTPGIVISDNHSVLS